MQLSTDLLKGKKASIDRNQSITIRAAGIWAIHVESSRAMLREMSKLYVDHDIQYAAATDGGRQRNNKDMMVAAAAAFRCDGKVVGGALDPHKLAPSSYEAELQALIDLLKSWPDDARVLVAIDARSPVQALVKFRFSHVNKRAEYFCDDMLDDLLIQIERMDTIIFYWLRGHSGAAPNEAADWHATELLGASVGAPIVRGPPRHAST